MDEKFEFKNDENTGFQPRDFHTKPEDKIVDILERIARAQEGMLAIAAEARQERLKLSAKMQEALKRPMQERPGA